MRRSKPSFQAFFLLCWLWPAFGFVAQAQSFSEPKNIYHFSHLGLNDGLSQSCVRTIIQDSRGFLWFGTQDGLNLYDGITFKVFKHDVSDSSSIGQGFINCIYETHDGKIWIGTGGGGLNMFNPLTGKFTRYVFDASNQFSISNNDIRCIAEDSRGVLWIGTDDGLNAFTPKNKQFLRFFHEAYNHRTLSNNRIRSVAIDRNDIIWIGTSGGGLNYFNYKSIRFKAYRHDENNPASISSDNVLSLMVASDGKIWSGTQNGGVSVFDPLTSKFVNHLHDENDPTTISANEVRSLFEDKRGRYVWVGTNGRGISVYDKTTDTFETIKDDQTDITSLGNDYIHAIGQDKSGMLWFGTWGNGLSIYNPAFARFFIYKNKPGDPSTIVSNDIWSIMRDDKKRLWFGTNENGVNIIDPATNKVKIYVNNENDPNSLSADDAVAFCQDQSGIVMVGTGSGLNVYQPEKDNFKVYKSKIEDVQALPSNDIRGIIEDDNGTVWIATGNKGICVFNNVTGQFKRYMNNPRDTNSLNDNVVQCIYEDRDGQIWVGTSRGGLNLLNPRTGHFTHYLYQARNPNSISSNNINVLCHDSRGKLWIGTSGAGISIFDKKTKKFTNYSEKDGLPNNVIYGMLEDNKGFIWLSTNRGLCRVTLSEIDSIKPTFKSYDESDGLPSNEFNTGAYYKDKDGRLYFGGIGGAVAFYPDSLRDNSYIPPIYFTSFKVFEKELQLDTAIGFKKHIILPYDQNMLTIGFVGLNYILPEKNKYAFMLEGENDKWFFSGNRNSAYYTSLPPGTYVFRVKAANNDGVWNEVGTSISITITPPWYRTYWFYTLCFLIGVACIVFYIKWRERELTVQKKILEKKVTERTRQLKREKDRVEEAYLQIDSKNKEITDSIKYAKRLQNAILPSEKDITTYLDSFIFFKPRDIVSGDFYYFERVNNNSGQTEAKIAVVDCTGHGVPGAFMSIVGSNLLNQAVNEHKKDKPSEILDELNHGLTGRMKQTQEEDTVKDGMDIALCSINLESRILQYAGAYNPLWVVRDDKTFIEVRADKFPVGVFINEEIKPFTNHQIDMKKGDCVYIFSDGYADQFGGPDGKKFKYKKLQELLMDIHNEAMPRQKEILEKEFNDWKGELDQVDDVLIIGFRIT